MCCELVEFVLQYVVSKTQCLNCDSVRKSLSLKYYKSTQALENSVL